MVRFRTTSRRVGAIVLCLAKQNAWSRLFKFGVAGFGKTQLPFRTAAMAHVSGRRGNGFRSCT